MSCGCDTDDSLEVGTAVQLTAEFYDDGVLVDPTTVTLRVRNPQGTRSTPLTVRDSTGKFHCDIQLNTAGQWWYRFEATGPIAADEGSFVVRRSSVI